MDEWLDFSDFIEKAQELIDLGLFDEAKALLDTYSSTFSDEWELYFLYSRLYAEQNKPREAIPYLHKGLSFEPTNADCLLGLFYAHAMMNKIQQAGRYLLRAEKYHPDSELILSALIWYYTEINQLQKAIDYFERIRAKGSTNQETFRNGGIAYDRIGAYDTAVECFRTALDLHPGFDEVRELLSDLYLAIGKSDKAIELYEKALAESPQNIRYLSRLIFCLSQSNRTEKAIETARESIRLYPNSPIGYVDLAYVHLNAGKLDEALASAEKALDISPIDAEGFRVKGIVFSEQGNVTEAESAFESALSLDRDNPEILRDYYHHFRQTGNIDKMEAMVFRVIEMEEPACIEEYWFLADFYYEEKEYGKSLHYLGKAYKIRPGEHELLPLIIEILLEKNHRRIALRFLARYVEGAGWNEVAARLAGHPELRTPTIQEGLRFLRFQSGDAPTEFNNALFNLFLRKHLIGAGAVVLAAATLPLYLLLGKIGIIGIAGFTAGLIGTLATVNYFRNREKAGVIYKR
jgi:tetratricopeptide (TPR) repeat protein